MNASADFLALIKSETPVYSAGRLRCGTATVLRKDCSCETHDGPHFLHADRSWRNANRRMVLDIKGGPNWLSLVGYGSEEQIRLRALRESMEAKGIFSLLTEEDVLSLRAAGEAVF